MMGSLENVTMFLQLITDHLEELSHYTLLDWVFAMSSISLAQQLLALFCRCSPELGPIPDTTNIFPLTIGLSIEWNCFHGRESSAIWYFVGLGTGQHVVPLAQPVTEQHLANGTIIALWQSFGMIVYIHMLLGK